MNLPETPVPFRRAFDPVTHRSTMDLRAVLGFLTRDDESSSAEDHKAYARRVLCPWLADRYAEHVDSTSGRASTLGVKKWVSYYLIKVREVGRVHITLSEVLSEEAMRRMTDESYFEYWAYAESLSL